ncbi:hypothetical protein [Actinomadura hibisca]|uniref:hypothetical protein n=1 Tax=Actinomadura hibisca TaxID=68565 RepID=UPI001FE05D9B|nr:hypothetical protein [Actinomadura hibisca]
MAIVSPDARHVHGDERIRLLMRRGVAFAREALRVLGASIPGHPVIVRVSTGEVATSPGQFTGYVTFFSAAFADAMRVGRAEEGDGVLVHLFSEECTGPFPGGTTH